MKPFLSAEEAAASLQISLETLYAYVSRGRVRSEPVAPGSRLRRYRAEDVTALRQQRAFRRSPRLAAEGALHWGLPVLDSGLTLIADGRLYYRGRNAAELATSASFEAACDQLLGATALPLARSVPELWQAIARLPAVPDLAPVAAIQVALPLLEAADPASPVCSPDLMRSRVGALAAVATAIAAGRAGQGDRGSAAALAANWCPRRPGAERLLNAALILCLDHELNASAFAARVVASAGGSLYQSVAGGLAALQGFRHGGASRKVEALWEAYERADGAAAVLREWKQREGYLPGFGHPLYPLGDPRATVLLALLAEVKPARRETTPVAKLLAQAEAVAGYPPNIDFALVAVSRALRLPAHAPITLFALGRMVGWAAHAIEQAGQNTLIRPRANYTGPRPA